MKSKGLNLLGENIGENIISGQKTEKKKNPKQNKTHPQHKEKGWYIWLY